MLIDETQCLSLLQAGAIEAITDILTRYKLNCIRLFEAKFSDQEGKINFLVQEMDDTDAFAIARATYELKRILNREDINIYIERDIDEDILAEILKNSLEFNLNSISAFYDTLQKNKPYVISANDNPDELLITVRIRKEPGVNYDMDELVNAYKETTEHEIAVRQEVPASPSTVRAH